MTDPTMTGTLARALARQGWLVGEARHTSADLILEWGRPATARLFLQDGAALLVEHLDRPAAAMTHTTWGAVTPDNVHRIRHYIEQGVAL